MRLFLALFLLLVPVLACGETGNLVKEAQVRQVISDFLAQKTAGLPAQVTVKKIGYSGDLSLPPGEVTYEVIAPPRDGRGGGAPRWRSSYGWRGR